MILRFGFFAALFVFALPSLAQAAAGNAKSEFGVGIRRLTPPKPAPKAAQVQRRERVKRCGVSVGASAEVVGFFYFRNRYLDPEQGRFVSRDPLGLWGDPGNLGNPYAYAGNDPVNRVDPFGLDGSAQAELAALDASAAALQQVGTSLRAESDRLYNPSGPYNEQTELSIQLYKGSEAAKATASALREAARDSYYRLYPMESGDCSSLMSNGIIMSLGAGALMAVGGGVQLAVRGLTALGGMTLVVLSDAYVLAIRGVSWVMTTWVGRIFGFGGAAGGAGSSDLGGEGGVPDFLPENFDDLGPPPLQNIKPDFDPDQAQRMTRNAMSGFTIDNGVYVNAAGSPLNGTYKAIVTMEGEFMMGRDIFGGHIELAGGNNVAVRVAGSFYFEGGRSFGADLTSGHYETKLGVGYDRVLRDAARAVGYLGELFDKHR